MNTDTNAKSARNPGAVSEFPKSAWSRVFGFDSRSLSLLRIGLGFLVLVDALLRWPDIKAMYTDDGYFTRALMDLYFTSQYGLNSQYGTWSVHCWSGSLEWQQFLFGAQGVLGVVLIFGFLNRLAVVGAWILVASLQIRNPLVITSGDFILKLMLFWSMFLPLARHFSIDAWLQRRRRNDGDLSEPIWVCSWATAAFLLQMILMYFFTGVAKCNDIWWSGDAMYYVLNLDIYVRPLGKAMLEYPWLLKWVTWLTVIVEVFAIWLLLVPPANTIWRVSLMLVYWGFHLGIALTMAIGWFPLICVVVWFPLIPSYFWNLGRGGAESVRPEATLTGWWSLLRTAQNGFCGVVLLVVLLWNLINIPQLGLAGRVPAPLILIGKVTAIDQHFQMFGDPPRYNPWFVYEARLKNGSKMELFHPQHRLHHEPPTDGIGGFRTHNWRKLHRNLTSDTFAAFRQGLLDFQVSEWNSRHIESEQVVSAKLIAYMKKTGPDAANREIISLIWADWGRGDEAAGSLFDDLEERLNSGTGLPF